MSMKKVKNIFLASMLLVACAFTACSSDDDNASLFLQAPTFELIEMASYDLSELDREDYIIVPIDFASSTAWQLTSDKIWVLFSATEDGQYDNDIIGAAGTHRVYMKITNEARTYEPAGANVVFNYGGYQYKLGTIYRHAKQYDTGIFDEEGNALASVEFDSDASATFVINAAYCGIKSYPEWLLEPSISNGAYTFNVKEEYTAYEMTGSLVVVSEDGSSLQEFPVNYSGMRRDIITLSGEYVPWGWFVSLDGKTFQKEGSSSSVESDTEDVFVENALPFTIKCFNYDCKFLFIEEKSDGTISIPVTPWLVAEQDDADPSLVNVSAKPFVATTAQRSRKGYILAVPSGIYDDVAGTLSAGADAATFIDNNVNYVLVEVTQKDIFAIEGFSVTGSDGSSFITEEEPAGDLYDWVSSELSITDVYTMTGVNGVKYTINTLYTEADWNGGYSIYDKSGNSYTNARVWGLSRKIVDGYYTFTLTVPAEARFAEPVIIRLHSSNVNKKALIIKPVNYTR